MIQVSKNTLFYIYEISNNNIRMIILTILVVLALIIFFFFFFLSQVNEIMVAEG